MERNTENLPIDARILGDAVIEFNISRRNVSIYPADHPSVKRSLDKVYGLFKKLFELRPEITLYAAGGTLIVDDHYLDKKNPVFSEFARHLNDMNISRLSFLTGLRHEEIYTFHKIISGPAGHVDVGRIMEEVEGAFLPHLKVIFIDYNLFSFRDGTSEEEDREGSIWEEYVYGMLGGSILPDGAAEQIEDIPPHILASIINKSDKDEIKSESYDRVISSYVRRTGERKFSSKELKRLMDFIESLNPDLKKQFLSSAVNNISYDMRETEMALKDFSVDEVIGIVTVIEEQDVKVPDALKNLLDRFSRIESDIEGETTFSGNVMMDDILLSSDIVSLLRRGNFEDFVTNTYQKEIKKLLDMDPSALIDDETKAMSKEFSEELISRDYCQLLLEVSSGKGIESEEEYGQIITQINDRCRQMNLSGLYGEVSAVITNLEKNLEEGYFTESTSQALQHFRSPEFLTETAGSFRFMGRLSREGAKKLAAVLGDPFVPFLFDALADEEEKSTRRFLIDMIKDFGEAAVNEAQKRLDDSRWYIKRNMLFILGECGDKGILPVAREYSNNDNGKIRLEAMKILLKFNDRESTSRLMKYLESDNREDVEQAITLSGNYRVAESVPILISMLKKMSLSGSDMENKVLAIRALGEIGDTSAIEVFRDLLSERSLIFKGSVDKVREEIYRVLKFFPFSSVEELAVKGVNSKNRVIREESVRMIRRAAREARKEQ